MIPPKEPEEPDASLGRATDQHIRKMIHEEIAREKVNKGPKPYPEKEQTENKDGA